jgi:cytochrome c peroxidase
MERDVMKSLRVLKSAIIIATIALGVLTIFLSGDARGKSVGKKNDKRSAGKHLFEQETFGGNGRTCLTCHGLETGTVSPEEAQARFAANPHDSLFAHDGSDDGLGNGVGRMLSDATILVEIPLPENVSLADDPEARSVIVRRGIPTTLNTPALDPLLMLDGRDSDLQTQARNAIQAHFQSAIDPRERDLLLIAEFQQTDRFFSSTTLREFARGGPAPEPPEGNTESERRGRRFFVDAPFDPATKAGICAACHSGPMLNQTNQFLPLPVQPGARFQNVAVSEFNSAGNPVREFIFKNPDGTKTIIRSPDPGRALITGDARAFPGDSLNAFKIPSLWGVRRTAPYFHDNSAKTLDDMATHYARFFEVITSGAVTLSELDKADMVAYLKLLE